MSIGIVQELGKSQSGNPKLKIDGQWYSAGRCDVSGVKSGDKIEYVFNEFGEPRNGKRPRGLEKWRPVVDESGKPETGSTVTEADILRSVSNVVGQACAAGTVKSPEELGKWFYEAWKGFHLLNDFEKRDALQKMAPANGGEPDFDDSDRLNEDMPDKFYENLPPQKASGKSW